MKRLYIGGLAHTISQKDLKDRFGKFGEVSDVEIITRKDGTGVPVKTFGYININISDEALRKCITVLNKSKWKGGTLQIEIAKESFLHRLAVERQQATEKTQSPKIEHKEKLMESFTKAGVENFHMKAAVPGTEVPGYKDWVVSKFGRVLPILHLKGQGKNKMFKYDPSKHSHNIRKLESTADVPTLTPVSELTWEILEGDDDISKKRRGEFPPQKVYPAKIRKESLPQINKNTHSVLGKEHHNATEKDHKALVARHMTGHNGIICEEQNSAIKRQSKSLCVFDSEADSDDEIRMLVAQEYTRVKDVSTEDEDNLEVVANDFTIKPNMVWASHKSKSDLAGRSCEDSDDTDEILTQSKAPTLLEMQREADQNFDTNCPSGISLNECDSKPSTKKRKLTPDSEILPKQSSVSESCNEGSVECDDSDCDEAMITDFHCIKLSLEDLEQLAKNASIAIEEENGDLLESDSLAGSRQATEVVLFSKMKGSTTQPAKKGNTPEEILAAILEEDSSDEDNNNDRKKKKMKKSHSPNLPAFMGTKALSETVPGAQPGTCLKRNKHEEDYERTESEKKLEHTSSYSNASEDENKRVEFKLLPFRGVDGLSLPNVEKVKQTDYLIKSNSSESTESNSDYISSDGEETKDSAKDHNRQAPEGAGKTSRSAPKHEIQSMTLEALDSASTSLIAESESIEQGGKSTKQFEENTTLKKPSQKMVCTENIQQKPQQDNQKRLAALEQKQKEAEQQQKLIQGALSMLDAPVASNGKHIVFDTDDESEEEAEPPVEYYDPTKSLFEESSEPSIDVPCEVGPVAEAKQHLRVKDFQKQGCGKLFNSREEEEEEEEDDDDDEARFKIKPQYEGKAGQKLMQLQSRFGTDERFRMDSRFLESDEESNIPADASSHSGVELELQEEKKKNLDILQSLLNINVRSTEASKEAAKTKAFRDISALHYDPTRLEHAAFEKKSEEPKKESKAARRKKREEAEKLPEVSKIIYYDVAMDLKEVFGSQKESAVVKPAAAWDKEEDQENWKEKQVTVEDTILPHNFSSNVSTEKAESTGFQFSFFGKDTAEDITAKDDYKTEILKKTKVLWQAFGTGFRDSSSEDEEEDKEEEGTGDQSAPGSATEERVSAKRTFFFYLQDDERLKVGPKMFWSSAKLEDQMAHWEEKRTFLIEEYRKKHKDARRRLKTSQKS